jgi:hypothetical protein
MTTDSSEKPAGRDESQQPRERGGAADIDRSKGLEEPDSPFGSRGKDAEADEAKDE